MRKTKHQISSKALKKRKERGCGNTHYNEKKRKYKNKN